MTNKFAGKTGYCQIRLVFIVVSLGMTVFGLGLLLFEPFREFIILFAERKMVFRLLNHAIWHKRLTYGSVSMLVFGVFMLGICLCGALEIIIRAAKRMYVYAKTIKLPAPLKYFSFLCLFLLLYTVFHLNILFIVFFYTIGKLKGLSWLENTFGEREVKTAFVLTGTTVLFFIGIMFFFRAAIVMDVLYGDSNRVLLDFTEVSSNHYRVKVHPFYVLIWQSLYHLFAPPKIIGSIAIRIMIAIFAGLNIGLFSLFVSRLTKSRLLNVMLCAVMAFSFPQIYHGSQMLESFIFTQASVLLMIVYFSFMLPQKEYRLTPLLAVSLFVAGNNIAYICLFGIFFVVLLKNTSETWKQAAKRFFVFAVAFLAIFSVLLLLQSLLYGRSAPSNIISMICGILSEEKSYIMIQGILSWPRYAKNFFNIIIFEHLPFGFGNILDTGWLWAFSLVLPFVLLTKKESKLLFYAIVLCCLFLFLFHGIYGSTELTLYAPVIMCVYLCLFAFVAVVLPKKFAACVCGILLAVIIPVNSIGTYTLHRMNNYVFGSLDSGEWEEYQENITSLQKIISSYKGGKLLFYQNLREENVWPQTPLHDEIGRAYENNDLDIVILPFAEANKAGKVFFFGLENRRKLVFEKAALRDFKTNEILYSFPDADITLRPWDFSVSIIDKNGFAHLIQETTTGVFVDGVLVEKTGGGG
ncbi:MAG: hypothetical protein LBG27_05215 [Spirochaetaceae bacterium]|jgi:hypothetical protein|nr:hypothetical protein [Spirochaetaceae bacterium]